MRKLAIATTALALLMTAHVSAVHAAAAPTADVEMEMMTWPELKKAIEGGKTTALIYTGGTEQRGPHIDAQPLLVVEASKLGTQRRDHFFADELRRCLKRVSRAHCTDQHVNGIRELRLEIAQALLLSPAHPRVRAN